jgi:hypothetical protein
MVDFFDNLYSSIQAKNAFLDKIKFYSLLRYIVRLISNVMIPLYFTLTKKNKDYTLKPSDKSKNRIIVSLTSFPARINRVSLVIETMLRQTHKPDKIILWLSKDQFKSLDILPKRLLELQKRGLEIKLRDKDLRSHKKYYYTIKEYPDDVCLTIDDDIFYNSHIIEYLVNCSNDFPDTICCNLSNMLTYKNEVLQNYNSWSGETNNNNPSIYIVPIGAGGVLYPVGVLNKLVLDEKIFMEVCPYADDIWLKSMSLLNKTKVVKTKYDSNYLPVLNKNSTKLITSNRIGGNDIQIKALQTYFVSEIGLDPFDYKFISQNC